MSKKSPQSEKPVKSRKEKAPTDKLADRTAMTKFLQGIFGDAQKKTLKRMYKIVLDINKLEEKYQALSDEELANKTTEFREKLGVEAAKLEEKAQTPDKKSKKSKKPSEKKADETSKETGNK